MDWISYFRLILFLTGNLSDGNSPAMIPMKINLNDNTTTTYPVVEGLTNARATTALDGTSVLVLNDKVNPEGDVFSLNFGQKDLDLKLTEIKPEIRERMLTMTRGENYVLVGHEHGAYAIPYGELALVICE